MALEFSDGVAEEVNHGSDASLDNLAAATVVMWANLRNNDNNFRDWAGKGTTITFFRRGVDGTRLAMEVLRAGANQGVDITAATVGVGWNFVAFTWDIAGAPAAYWGDLITTVTDQSFGAVGGGGAKSDDSANDWTSGNVPGDADSAAPYNIATFGIWNRNLILGELKVQQFWPHPTSGCVMFCHYGYNGIGTQADWSGNGNNGTIAGAVTVADHVPLGPFFGYSMFPPSISPSRKRRRGFINYQTPGIAP